VPQKGDTEQVTFTTLKKIKSPGQTGTSDLCTPANQNLLTKLKKNIYIKEFLFPSIWQQVQFNLNLPLQVSV
jgi:hypothetical protein